MALIKCPECGREISDKAEMCIGCGYPLEKYAEDIKSFENDMEPCPFCNYANKRGVDYCDDCGMRITEYTTLNRNTNVDVVENYKISHGYPKRECPCCGGYNYHAVVEDVVILEGKVKSKTTLNLNPFKPFTVFNHKEKVVRKPWTKQVSKFVCDDCGHIFQ